MTGRAAVAVGATAMLLIAGCADADGAAIEDLRQRVIALEADNADLEARVADAEAAVAAAATTTTSITTTTSTVTTTTTAAPVTTTTGPRLVDVDGYFDLVDNRNWRAEGDGCVGRGAYAELEERFQLTLVADEGQTLGVAAIGLGTPHEAGDLGTDYGATFLRFAFEFRDVPLDSEFYTVASRRGDVVFTRQEALFGLTLVIGDE